MQAQPRAERLERTAPLALSDSRSLKPAALGRVEQLLAVVWHAPSRGESTGACKCVGGVLLCPPAQALLSINVLSLSNGLPLARLIGHCLLLTDC